MRKSSFSTVFLVGLAAALLISGPTVFASPIGWWKFDEGTGYIAYDSVGSNNGTVYGATWTAGRIAGALSFDGNLDYVLVGDKDNLEQQAFTLSFWARLNNPSGSLQGGIAKGYIFGSPLEFSYKIDFDSGYAWPAITNTSNTAFGMACPIVDVNWHMWSMTVGGGTLTLYKDGAFVNSTGYTGTIDYTKNDNNFVIGARKYGSYSFNGKIDDVRFYNKALSAEEILQLYLQLKASNPIPADRATGVDLDVVLGWLPGQFVASHDVYFGTDYNNVNIADSSSQEYKGNFIVNSFDPGGLNFFTTYYWRIDERSPYGITKCDIWSFRTHIEGRLLYVPSEYPTIQAAIDAASDWDFVIVAPGTYTGTGNRDIDFKGKTITVRSIDPKNPSIVAATVIDCENSGRGFYFHNGEGKNSVVCGLSITRGSAIGNPAVGGGIYCGGSSPTIKNCIITNNSANGASNSFGDGESGYGGGVYCISNSHLTLINCEVSGNQAIGGDGGYRYCLVYAGCFGIAGRGGDGIGGGIFSSEDSSLTVVSCRISGNLAAGGLGGTQEDPWAGFSGGEAVGGGICSNGSLFINDCVIAENRADGGDGGDGGNGVGAGADGCGGGVFCSSFSSVIYNCIIVSNWAFGGYGGHNHYGGPDGAGGIAYGAGAYCSSAANISNCTITENKAYGGGWYNRLSYGDGINGVGTTTITNCILWGNGDDLSGCSATYSCISDTNDGGIGVIHSNPLFVNAAAGDLHLSPGSPCIDTGDNNTVPTGVVTDLDGRNRFVDGDCNSTVIVDMGAYEFTHAYFGDFDSDCRVDFYDYAILAASWLQNNSLTDIAPAPAGDGLVDISDLAVLCNNWLESF